MTDLFKTGPDAPFTARRRIPHDGSRRVVATGIIRGPGAQVMIAGPPAAAEAIRAGLVTARRERAGEAP